MYWYESHMGGLYNSDEEIPYEYLYCDSCGDSDRELGYAETFADAWKLLSKVCYIFNGRGNYDLHYVFKTLCEAYNVAPQFKEKRITDRRILRKIGEISGKPVSLFYIHKPCIERKTGEVWFYDDFVVADTPAEAAKKAYVSEIYVKKVAI